MTEIERIVAKGVVPENFFEPAVVCDFLVDSKRKKIWAIELEMLLELDRICRKHNLKYFLAYGTLLGAIRHKGFIPWDDDADVIMPRDDYEKFIQLQDEFRNPLFLQTPYTDPEYFVSHSRIRNSNTTAISPIMKYQKMNQGIFIDIFPLDHVVMDGAQERFNQIQLLNIANGTYMRRCNPELDEKNRKRVAEYHRNPMEDYEQIHKIASQFNTLPTEKLAVTVCTMDALEHNLWDVVDYENVIEWEYEGHKLFIPAAYDKVLKGAYGDYMQLPPVEKRGMQHGHYLFDPDTPYIQYLK